MPKDVNSFQRDYYHNNRERIRKQRLMKRIDRGLHVRPRTIEQYDLIAYADDKGYDTKIIRVNEMEEKMVRLMDAQVKRKVEKRLENFDREVERVVSAKLKQLRALERGDPMVSGPFSLRAAKERLGQTQWQGTTRKGHKSLVEQMVITHLKEKEDIDLVELFNDYKTLIPKIRTFKQIRGKKKGQPYADYANFYNIPVTLKNNIPEFGRQLTTTAYLAYKSAYQEEKNVARKRQKLIIDNTEYPDIQELSLTRKFLGYDAPGSIYHLISALYTLNPSVRNDYGCVHLVKNGKPEMDETSNYYDVDKGVFYLQSYKTKKAYGTLEYTFNPLLVKIIDLWLAKSGNKKYLISRHNYTKKYKTESLHHKCATDLHSSDMSALISETFNQYMKHQDDEKSINMRAIRVIWVRALEKVTDERERTKLAKAMGHSLDIARDIYLRKTEGIVPKSTEVSTTLKDYGEKGYPFTKKFILENDIDYRQEDNPYLPDGAF